MDVSKFLAKVIGIYLVIISFIMLVHMQQFKIYIDNMIHFGPLLFVVGFFTTILGILMVVSHNIWQWNWRMIVTVFGWVVLLKGLTLILYPIYIVKMSIFFLKDCNVAYTSAGACLMLGLIVLYFGLYAEKEEAKVKKLSTKK